MVCSEWDVTGLLYSSKELDVDQAKKFEDHLRTCIYCKDELELYQKEKIGYFNLQNLQESPSKKVDDEILRVCSNSRKQITSFNLLPSFLKKTAFSVTFFVVGFVVVGYLAMNMNTENGLKNNIVLEKSEIPQQLQATKVENKDSLSADSIDTNLYFSKTRGTLDSKGVFPVDLKNK